MKVSPPNSFIHTADFPSPKALAQVLVMVSVIVFLIMSSFGSYTKYISWGEGGRQKLKLSFASICCTLTRTQKTIFNT